MLTSNELFDKVVIEFLVDMIVTRSATKENVNINKGQQFEADELYDCFMIHIDDNWSLMARKEDEDELYKVL